MYRQGFICLNDWSGYVEQPVWIVGETPKRYRVTPAGPLAIKLAGRCRWLQPGAVALVPKRAVKLKETT